jgi:hypothetical protein
MTQNQIQTPVNGADKRRRAEQTGEAIVELLEQDHDPQPQCQKNRLDDDLDEKKNQVGNHAGRFS